MDSDGCSEDAAILSFIFVVVVGGLILGGILLVGGVLLVIGIVTLAVNKPRVALVLGGLAALIGAAFYYQFYPQTIIVLVASVALAIWLVTLAIKSPKSALFLAVLVALIGVGVFYRLQIIQLPQGQPTQAQFARTVSNTPADREPTSTPVVKGRVALSSESALPTTSPPTSGIWVMDVERGSEAASAGFRKGHVLLTLNGQVIQTAQLAREIVAHNIGSQITAVVWQDGKEITIAVTPQDKAIGLTLCQLDRCPGGKYPQK
jgi:membrane-associated protease RseP (regulator of RpoE activity)